MPIYRFRSVEDMPARQPLARAGLWRRITELWSLSSRLYVRRFPPGVYKNRTLDEAHRRRLAW
jgi:hypothetical protein